jgi:hypothetical protein
MNSIIKYQEKHNIPVNETWKDMAQNVNIPRAQSGITMEYDGMLNNVTVKQADVTLISFPLTPSQDYTLERQRQDLEYYNQKQTPDGPAMTSAIAAININRISATGCGTFTADLQARLANLRAPWYQMSEQADDDRNANGGVPPAFPFLTGHGGSLQITPFGYLGITLTKDVLQIRPSLPHPLNNLKIRDFYYGGNKLRATMNSTHTNITRLPVVDVEGLVDKYLNQEMPVMVESRDNDDGVVYGTIYSIPMNGTITVPNDMYWKHATTHNNVLQCQPTASKSETIPGQYAGAANDGNSGGRWQPKTDGVANLTVDTSMVQYQRVMKMNFDFRERRPEKLTIGLTNQTDLTSVYDAEWVIPISLDFLHNEMACDMSLEPIIYLGNMTMWMPPAGFDVWTGKYAILEMEGCRGCGVFRSHKQENGPAVVEWEEDGLGASVGEFEIIGENGMGMPAVLGKETSDQRQSATDEVLDELLSKGTNDATG